MRQLVKADTLTPSENLGEHMIAIASRVASSTADSDLASVIAAQRDPWSASLTHLAPALERLVEQTKDVYSATAGTYEAIRGHAVKPHDHYLNQLSLASMRENLEPLPQGGSYQLLDIGAGYGRDVAYFEQFPDLMVSVVENNPTFLAMLRNGIQEEHLRVAAMYETDMRTLEGVPENHFHMVRSHATLHHLPLLPLGLGADEAMESARRVCVNGGVLHCVVRRGREVRLIDTAEGMGGRFYQEFEIDSLVGLLSRHGFETRHLEAYESKRPSGIIPWLYTLARAV